MGGIFRLRACTAVMVSAMLISGCGKTPEQTSGRTGVENKTGPSIQSGRFAGQESDAAKATRMRAEYTRVGKEMGKVKSGLINALIAIGFRKPEPSYEQCAEIFSKFGPGRPGPCGEPEAVIAKAEAGKMESEGKAASFAKQEGVSAREVAEAFDARKTEQAKPQLKPVQNLAVNSKPEEPSKIDLSWETPPDSKSVAAYNVYRDGVFMKSVTGTVFSQDDLAPDTSYCYVITAVGPDGKEIEGENVCTRTGALPDDTPPNAPIGLTVFVASPRAVEMYWKASEDNVLVGGYNIYQNGSLVASIIETKLAQMGLEPDTRYCYAVTSFDSERNESAGSNEVCVKTKYEDVKRPTVPAGLTVSEVAGSQIDLSWGDSDDDVGVVGYNIYQDGVFLKAVASTSAFNIEAGASETNCYTISATDKSGNESRRGQQVCVTRKDDASGRSFGGTLWAGGVNEFGQLGQGGTDPAFTLSIIDGVKGIALVSAGLEHALALKADGSVLAWGRNDKGQVGDGSATDHLKPVEVQGIGSIVDISAGWAHSLALASDGTVWAWGRNYYGQLGDGTTLDHPRPVKIKGLSGIVAIAAGGYHSLALASDGTVWAWGWNHRSQLGIGGKGSSLSPAHVKGIRDIETLDAGMYHSVALRADGTLWAWGANEHGQLGTGNTLDVEFPVKVMGISEVEAVSTGMNHTVALRKDGTVWAWGRNEYGQLGSPSDSKKVSPALVEGIVGVKEISAGSYHTITLLADGTVWGWGWKGNTRYTAVEAIPGRMSGLTGIVAVSAGRQYTLAVRGK